MNILIIVALIASLALPFRVEASVHGQNPNDRIEVVASLRIGSSAIATLSDLSTGRRASVQVGDRFGIWSVTRIGLVHPDDLRSTYVVLSDGPILRTAAFAGRVVAPQPSAQIDAHDGPVMLESRTVDGSIVQVLVN